MIITRILDHQVIPLHDVQLVNPPWWYKCIICELEIYHQYTNDEYRYYKNGWQNNQPIVPLDITCSEQIIKKHIRIR